MKFQSIKDSLALCFLTFFGTGYAPKAPGTVGSFFTLPLIFLLYYFQFSFWQISLFILILIISSSFVAEYIQKKLNCHDPGWIVIDEVIGMLITWLFVFPSISVKNMLLVFILFRLFDIIKIFPASYFDKTIKHGFGTIFDDCISGIYAGLSLLAINYCLTLLNT